MAARTKVKPKLMTHREVADLLSVDSETLRKWVAGGEWPEPLAIIKSTWFYKRDQVDHFLETGLWPEGTKFKSGVGKGRVLGP